MRTTVQDCTLNTVTLRVVLRRQRRDSTIEMGMYALCGGMAGNRRFAVLICYDYQSDSATAWLAMLIRQDCRV